MNIARGIFAAVLLLATLPAWAGIAPTASLSVVTGKVQVARANSPVWIPATESMVLYQGDRIRTRRGRAEVVFANGSRIRLHRKTTLEITEMKPAALTGFSATVTRLWKGWVRAIVRPLTKGSTFKIRSASAVAAVKGTDFTFDGSAVAVFDEGDAGIHEVLLSDLAEKRSVLIGEGMGAEIRRDGTLTEPHPVDAARFEKLQRVFELKKKVAARVSEAAAEELQELREEVAEFAESREIAEQQDRIERLADIQFGKVLMDRHGFRVRVAEHVFRPHHHVIQHVVLNERQDGPSAGVTYMQNSVVFNKPLPENFEDIRRSLDGVAFDDPTRMPEYWVAEEHDKVVNPHGDYIQHVVDFLDTDPTTGEPLPGIEGKLDGEPFLVQNQTLTGPVEYWAQSWAERMWVGTAEGGMVPKEHFLYNARGMIKGGWYAGADPQAACALCSDPLYANYSVWDNMAPDPTGQTLYPYDPVGGPPDFGNLNFGSGNVGFSRNEAGGFVHHVQYGDGTELAMAGYLIDNEGHVLQPEEIFTRAESEGSLETLIDQINVEMEFAATEFDGRMIDLVVVPHFFFEEEESPKDSTGTPETF